jgi:mRNA interferase RelE/StbE
MTYALVLSTQAQKFLDKADPPLKKTLTAGLWELQQDPRRNSVKQLKGTKTPTFRYRVGDYRIVFSVDHGKVVVFVIDIGNRKDIYR